MKARFTPRALTDLDQILAHIAYDAPQASIRVEDRIRAVAAHVAAYPKTGKRTSNRAMRRVSVPPNPYLIFYVIEPGGVVVIGIRHGARDPKTMPGSTG